jgi:hypothetical protein
VRPEISRAELDPLDVPAWEARVAALEARLQYERGAAASLEAQALLSVLGRASIRHLRRGMLWAAGTVGLVIVAILFFILKGAR